LTAPVFDTAYSTVYNTIELGDRQQEVAVAPLQIVIDTNVLLAGLRSPRGASYQILRLMGHGYFDAHNDDMILEVAVASGAAAIVTFNKHDFRGCERFGLRLLTPGELLKEIGVLK
jgi:predicted nucleic acid-binding protein